MRTLQVVVPDTKYACLDIQENTIDWDRLLEIIEVDRLKQMLDDCVEESENCGLSEMTMDEINAEIKAYRAEKPF